VEVVWGPETSDATRDSAVRFVERLGKVPIVVKDAPGFASSRLGIVLGMEAIRMVEQGVASPEDIDKAMELGYRHPMGPLKLTDLVGLDVRLGIAEYLHETLGSDAFESPALLRRMVDEGKLGKKSGRGFYDW
jgi:3-hydroxybutyryl-CoA dehydrogenase